MVIFCEVYRYLMERCVSAIGHVELEATVVETAVGYERYLELIDVQLSELSDVGGGVL